MACYNRFKMCIAAVLRGRETARLSYAGTKNLFRDVWDVEASNWQYPQWSVHSLLAIQTPAWRACLKTCFVPLRPQTPSVGSFRPVESDGTNWARKGVREAGSWKFALETFGACGKDVVFLGRKNVRSGCADGPRTCYRALVLQKPKLIRWIVL